MSFSAYANSEFNLSVAPSDGSCPVSVGTEASIVLGGNGAIWGLLAALLCVKRHSRDEVFPSTINIIYFCRPGFNAVAGLCTSAYNRTLILEVMIISNVEVY